MADRREEIADAGIRLIAGRGLRALTHRAIDNELGLAVGSTSYYARTRRELIALIAHRLAHRTRDDLTASPVPPKLDVPTAAAMMAALLDEMSRRSPDHLARFALLLELRDDDELHALLSRSSPIRSQLLQGAGLVLDRLDVERPEAHAPDLVAVLDGLLFDRVVGSSAADAEETLRAFLTGLPRRR
ncbi:MAG: TetR family transcriptional regulator [Cryobacterium sp.]|nr:TetR family transcriptional regulator [Cryobacterium sp.]